MWFGRPISRNRSSRHASSRLSVDSCVSVRSSSRVLWSVVSTSKVVWVGLPAVLSSGVTCLVMATCPPQAPSAGKPRGLPDTLRFPRWPAPGRYGCPDLEGAFSVTHTDARHGCTAACTWTSISECLEDTCSAGGSARGRPCSQATCPSVPWGVQSSLPTGEHSASDAGPERCSPRWLTASTIS